MHLWRGAAFLFAACAFAAPIDFTRDVEPIFARRCHACHGSGQQMNGLRLDDRAAALKGGVSGQVIVPGKSAESKLIQRVTSTKKSFAMPPAGGPLTAGEIATLRAWIDAGARWPQAQAKGAGALKTSHWSFQPIRRPQPPPVRQSSWLRNPTDAFILARLEKEQIEPSPEASRHTLIRRLSLDLTGLPPTPAEVSEFLADARPDAYERLVDRLLASPHFGEKWARHWLDAAHYADSDGYEKDLVRPYAWRYRNWVIDAFNHDLPFDQFTIEQIAGDLLPNATTEQRVATGFHRTVLTNREAGVDRAEARFEQMVNRVNTIGTAWLGVTVGCAQCHNHKYDPITQRDYYQLMAFVNNLEEAEIDAPLPGELGPWLEARPRYERERALALRESNIADLQAHWEEKMRAAIAKPGVDLEWDFAVTSFKAMVDNAVKLIQTDAAQRTSRQVETLTDYFLGRPGPEYSKDAAKKKGIQEARDRITKLKAALPPFTEAMSVVESPDQVKTHVAVRGDYRTPGEEVQAAVPAVLPPLKTAGPATRLDLARWLVSKENPLTARVAANRIWQELFSKGIVRTAEDFGTQGERPTHPELLDWLASEFRDHGWSTKQLIRTIVTSSTYRQSSKVREELLSRVPDNSLLARQSRPRLPAELIRDSALAASGLLSPAIGGRSVRPPQPAGVAELGYANNVKWVESKGSERYRRGLYIHFQRTTPYPMLMTFDAPDSNVACTRRSRSNTPLQALNLLNDPVFFEAAQALALRTLHEVRGGFGERLEHLFELALARRPTPAERERLARYFDQQLGILRNEPESLDKLAPLPPEGVNRLDAAGWVTLARVVLNLDEFVTRE
ncbi:MAG: PSD1 domain-containing protein [Acidobacteria bacterium]|nr:PSD1 domain-containing protein [Acidobacteriota bacterium]